MHVKLLSSEAFFSPKCSKYRSRSAQPRWWVAYSAPPDYVAGSRALLLREGKG